MKSPDNVRQLVVIVGKVKEIEGAQGENKDNYEDTEDSGSDEVVDEEMDENFDMMINKTKNKYIDESDESIVSGVIDEKEMDGIDEINDEMMNQTQKKISDERDETNRKEIKDKTIVSKLTMMRIIWWMKKTMIT